jgi:molybdate transport system substrate-binding protein
MAGLALLTLVGRRWRSPLIAGMVVVLALAGCTGGGRTATPPARIGGTLTVLASTSLTEAARWMVTVFTTAHPGTTITVQTGADSELAPKALSGRPAVDLLLVEGLATLAPFGAGANGAVAFAGNQLVIAVAPGDPLGISRLSDLARPGLRVAMCAPAEPCGAAAAGALRSAGVRPAAPILVNDVRSARDDVAAGLADAAIVYRTDTRMAASTVDTVEFTESGTAVIAYQALILPTAPNAVTAQAFLAFLRLPSTVDFLVRASFQGPPTTTTSPPLTATPTPSPLSRTTPSPTTSAAATPAQ